VLARWFASPQLAALRDWHQYALRIRVFCPPNPAVGNVLASFARFASRAFPWRSGVLPPNKRVNGDRGKLVCFHTHTWLQCTAFYGALPLSLAITKVLAILFSV
jgi:hypothetical protein